MGAADDTTLSHLHQVKFQRVARHAARDVSTNVKSWELSLPKQDSCKPQVFGRIVGLLYTPIDYVLAHVPVLKQSPPWCARNGLARFSCSRLTLMVEKSIVSKWGVQTDQGVKVSVAYREPMCRCTLGTPAGISQQANEAQRNAKLTYQMWQNQGQLFMPREQPSVDNALPALLRKTISEPTVMPLPSGKLLICSNFILTFLILL